MMEQMESDNTEDEDDFDLDPVLDRDELEMMDEDERREALEDAGYDPDDFDDFYELSESVIKYIHKGGGSLCIY